MADDRNRITVPERGRPALLFPLFSGVESLPGVGPKAAEALAQMDITRARDLVLLLPTSGLAWRRISRLAQAQPPENIVIPLQVIRHMAPTARGRPWRVTCSDGQHEVKLVFFHPRRDWIEKQLPVGQSRVISGKIELFDGHRQIVHPDSIGADMAAAPPDFEPIYPLSGRLTQGVMRRAIAGALTRLPEVGEWIDPALKLREGWPDWQQALHQSHAPQGVAGLGPADPARARLAYDELFAHQLTLLLVRRDKRRRMGRINQGNGALRDSVLAGLPWKPTQAQQRALAEIEADMAAPHRMNRLVQGDVGSGKTLVAFLALLIAVEAGGQGVMMAPTEVLARQHYRALQPWADLAGIRLEVLTGRDRGDARENILMDLAAGRIDILVGTHAVIQKTVVFSDLRLAVIDEQHRFGVAQRLELAGKGDLAPPDMMVMTATPIPRSLALTQYGDMDLSVLDEKPPGRQPIVTSVLPVSRIDDIISRLQKTVQSGARAYWVCPLVEESEVVDLTAAEARFQALRAIFGDDVRLVHGQMSPEQRDAGMADFAAGRARILVATTVIEVGVDVPEATIMVIERAERFGLAQLHQLRGRVGRGAAASSCLLLYQEPLSENGRRRLQILRESEDGFRIAEEDMLMRGAGNVIGTAQSGLPRFRIADLERQAPLMAMARQDAQNFLQLDPEMTSPRGRAVRVLLWLMEQDKAIRLIGAG